MTTNEYITLPVEVIESIKDFDTWKEFKNDPNFFKGKDVIFFKKSKLRISESPCPWDNYSGTHF